MDNYITMEVNMNRTKRNIIGVMLICTVMVCVIGCNNQMRDSKTADTQPKPNLTAIY